MVSRRSLGVSYFLGLGLGLIVSLFGYFILVDSAADLRSIGTITAIGFASTLPYLGYWLKHSDLSDTAVWSVAHWCAIGLAIPTVLITTLMFFGIRPQLVLMFPHLLVNLLAAGAVTGAMLGLIRELRRQYSRVDELNQRNKALNYLMSHDIRNDVNVIWGYVNILSNREEDVNEDLLRPIQRKSEDILEISQIARELQRLDENPDDPPTDIAAQVTETVETIHGTYPEATISTNIPDELYADVGDVIRSVITNLIENAIEHNDQDPEIVITLYQETTPPDDDVVILKIQDNGPGIPDSYREALEMDPVPVDEIPGLGLWLVKWVIKQYDGTIQIDDNKPRGTTVTIELPAHTPRIEHRQEAPA